MFRTWSRHHIVTIALCAISLALVLPSVAAGAGVVKADAGEWFSVVVLSDGTLWGWGYNSQGQLGDGTLETHLSPSRIDNSTSWTDVSAGWRHTAAIKSDGTLWSWGYNKDGQLGIGHAENTLTPDHLHKVPERVGSSSSWLRVSAGHDHSVALDMYGGLWAWGANGQGQLGIGSTTPTSTPVLVASPGPGLFWSRAWADDVVTLALASDGSLWQWGAGVTSPTIVGFSSTLLGGLPASAQSWLTVWPAFGHVSAVMSGSQLWTWQLGAVSPLAFGDEYLDVAGARDPGWTSDEAALLISLDHSLWIATNSGGSPVPLEDATFKYIIGNDLDWNRMSAGENHILISKSDGSLWGWGKNTFGQLGNGSEVDRTSRTSAPVRAILPTPIPNVTHMTESDARDRILQRGFKVGTVGYAATNEVEITRIISQTPAVDTLVMPGGAVNIVVSAGPPIAVPNVVGMQEAVARQAMGDAGLGVSGVSGAYSLAVPAGAIISQNPVAGTPVIIASKVALVVSRGRQPKTVPYTSGKTESQARTALTSAGFSVGSVLREYSTYPAGQVARTSPAAGIQAFQGDSVNIYVSLGKPKVALSSPIAPATMYKSRYRAVYGYLRPRHAAGTYPVRIYKWKKTASGSWKSYGYVTAKASNVTGDISKSKYARSMALPSAGKWRLRACAPADSKHATTWSSGYDYITVK